MAQGSDGYAIGTPYTAGWYREQTPTWTTYVAEWQGFAAPRIERPFRYLDLGCGRGVTAAWVAACHPAAEVWGVDFDPEHVAMARRYADALGVGARFVEAAFGALGPGDLPRFDVVALHGVWSWVTPARRAEIVGLLARHLEPGGLLYVGYNALPGRASSLGMQRLLREAHRRTEGSTDVRLDAGLALLERVRDGAHFAAQPQVLGLLDRFRDRERRYVAHEYLVDGWDPSLLSDLARDLAPAGLEFVGSANLVEDVEVLALDPERSRSLQGVADPVLRETLRDFLLDTGFRRDVFRRGAPRLSRAEQVGRLLDRRYALAAPRVECALGVRVPAGNVTLAAEEYTPVLDRLAAGVATGAEIVREAGRGAAPAQVLRRLGVLAAVGYVDPGLPDEGLAARSESLRAANGRSLRLDDDHVLLGSPLTGLCSRLSRFEVQALRAAPEADPGAAALRALRATGHTLALPGEATEEALLAEARARASTFLETRLPGLRAAGALP